MQAKICSNIIKKNEMIHPSNLREHTSISVLFQYTVKTQAVKSEQIWIYKL